MMMMMMMMMMIRGEKESTVLVVTAQGQPVSTNCFKNKVFKEEIDSKCLL